MSEFSPTYQVYYYDQSGEYSKYKQSDDKETALDYLAEAKGMNFKEAHIQLSFKKGGSVPDSILASISPVLPIFKAGGKTAKYKFKVRFHLGRGENYMKWKIEDVENKTDKFYDPEKVNLVLSDCKLTNQPTTANKIFTGQMNKAPIAYVQCNEVSVIEKDDQIRYNPRVAPNWINKEQDNIDNTSYDQVVSEGRSLFAEKDGNKFEIGGFIDLSPQSLNNGFNVTFNDGGKIDTLNSLKIALKYADEKDIYSLQNQIDKLEAPNKEIKVPEEYTGNTSQLLLFTEVTDIPILTPENVAYQIRLDREKEAEPKLTMLSFGGGQDSYCILYKMIKDKEFRKRYAPNDFFVCMSDTGNEFPYTYKAVKEAKKLCEENGIHFKFLKPDDGYHTPAWPNLTFNLKKNDTILSASMGVKACTANLKISPVDKYMYEYMCDLYGYPKTYGKADLKLYEKEFKTKVRVIIGFAKDEEMRVIKTIQNMNKLAKWKQKHVQFCFPLIEEGITRQLAQDIIGKYHEYIVPPSNCMLCFYQGDQELIWLERNHPEQITEWIKLEKAKVDKSRNAGVPDNKNKGVFGALLLPAKLEAAKNKIDKQGVKLGDYTDEQLWEYKMSHGHCVKSNF
tara:strand:- start:4493 stop:6352 length:1860 start_codon:yes stop_codon:yes gene_type:complete